MRQRRFTELVIVVLAEVLLRPAWATENAQAIKIREMIENGNLCGAAEQLNSVGSRTPEFQVIQNDLLKSTMALSPDQIMGCIPHFSTLLRAAPGNDAQLVLLEKAQALFDKADYASAEKYFERFISSYPNGQFLPWAVFYHAECNRWLGKKDEAVAEYEKFIRDFPNNPLAIKAKHGMAGLMPQGFIDTVSLDEYLMRRSTPTHDVIVKEK